MGTQSKTAIRVTQELAQSPSVVWRALTDPVLISEWFLPTDFAPVVGQAFTFTRTANAHLHFSDIIDCQVNVIEPGRLLAYAWTDAEYQEFKSTVTWTLRPHGTGTTLELEHAGYDPGDPIQQEARSVMEMGWGIYVGEHLVATIAQIST
jgi:uncharacterized protein YndB with AHSA1/START domain